MAGALGLGIPLEVIDILGQLFFLIGGACGIQILARFGKGTFLDMDTSLEKADFRQGFGVWKFLWESSDQGESFGEILFSLGRFLGGSVALSDEGLKDVVGGLLENIFFLREGLEFSVGGDGRGPLTQIVLGSSEKKVGAGQVWRLGKILDEGLG